MNRHMMPVPQTSLQGSCKLVDGALLLHPVLDAPREICPELDTSADFSADLLHGYDRSHQPKPSAKRTKPSRLPMGSLNARRPHGPELGHLQIRRPLKLRSWVDAGAAHPANARSVTQSFPTTGKPVDTRKTGNVLKTERIAAEVRFPHFVEKGGDSLNLRKCGGRP